MASWDKTKYPVNEGAATLMEYAGEIGEIGSVAEGGVALFFGLKLTPQEARERLEAAARAGDPRAMVCLSNSYRERGGAKELLPAIDWAEKAYEMGYPPAALALGEAYEVTSKWPQVHRYYKEYLNHVDAGQLPRDRSAMFAHMRLGYILGYGASITGVEEDGLRAARHVWNAVSLSEENQWPLSPLATRIYAQSLSKGWGGTSDIEKALSLLGSIADDVNNSQRKWATGDIAMIHKNQGNMAKATEWAKRAVALGNEGAAEWLEEQSVKESLVFQVDDVTCEAFYRDCVVNRKSEQSKTVGYINGRAQAISWIEVDLTDADGSTGSYTIKQNSEKLKPGDELTMIYVGAKNSKRGFPTYAIKKSTGESFFVGDTDTVYDNCGGSASARGGCGEWIIAIVAILAYGIGLIWIFWLVNRKNRRSAIKAEMESHILAIAQKIRK
jgi:TPR repeat protein